MMSPLLRRVLGFGWFMVLAGFLGAQTVVPPSLGGIIGGGSVELGQRVVLQVNVSGAAADFTYQWRRNGTNLPGATAVSYTLEAVTAADSATYTVAVTNAAGTSVATTDVTVKAAAAPVITTQPRTTTASVGQTITFIFSATGSFPRTYQWRKDGADLNGATDAALTLTAITTAQAGAYTVVITNALGTVTSSPASLTVNAATPPVVNSSLPFDVQATQGASVTLSSSLSSGSSPFTYQWFKAGVAIAGATNNTLAFSAVTLADAGKYSYTVSNIAGSATSREATLTVNPPTPITFFSHPQSQTLFVGQSLSLNISFNGSSPLTYQWRKNGADLAGATNSGFGIPAVALTDAGSYTVAITNPAGTVTSNAAVVTVSPPEPPAISSQPAGVSVAYGGSFSISVRAGGSSPFTFSWRKDGVAVTTGVGSGSTTSSITVSSAVASSAGTYTVIVTNAAGSVTSNPAVVTVAAPVLPVFSSQPQERQVAVGLAASFSANFSTAGAGNVGIQWFKDGLALPGATSSTYSINVVSESDAGSYTMQLTSAAGVVTSAAARLIVLPPAPPSVPFWPTGGAGNLGESFSLSVSSIQGTGPFAYQWAKGGVPITGATQSFLAFSSLTLGDYGTYTVTISNDGGLVTSPAMRISPVNASAAFSGPVAPPWVDAARLGDVVYFLATSPARIERYDLAGERWLPTVILSETQVPAAFAVADEGVYIAYGRTIARRSVDLANETVLTNTGSAVTQLFVFGNFLYYNSTGSSGGFGSATYATLHRTTLAAGPNVSLGSFYGPFRSVALAPSISKGFARSTSVSPADILMFTIGADGRISGETDSPYHGDMPVGSRPVVFPGDQLVADDSGTVYRTSNLSYAGSFGEGFTDLGFLSDGSAVVLRGAQLSLARADTFVERSRTAIPRLGVRLFTRGTNAHVFSAGATSAGVFTVTKVTAAEFQAIDAPASAPVPTGRYSIDDAFLGDGNVVYVFSRSVPGFVRWDPASRTFLPTVPLRDSPTRVFHQPGNRRALVQYVDGAITEVPLNSAGRERTLFQFGHVVRALTDLTDLVCVNFNDAGSSGDARLLFGLPEGPKFINVSLYEASGLAWQPATRRLYSTPAFSSSGLQFEVISSTGTLGAFGTGGQYTGTAGAITPPIRFNAEGSLLVSRNGRVLNADLASVGVLANDIADGAWLGNLLYTLRADNGGSQVQAWARATYLQSGTRALPGTPVRILRLSDTQLLVVTSFQGFPSFTILNGDLSVEPPPGIANLAGVYFGRLGANGAAGDFALSLKADRTGTLLIHLNTPRAELVATDVSLGSDGAFFANARDLATGARRLVQGSVSSGGLVGTIPSLNLTLTAAKSATGSAPAGVYVAPAVAGANGTAYAIVAPDGRALLLARSGTAFDGGTAGVSASGQLALTTTAGAKLTAAIAATGALAVTADAAGFASTSFAGLRDDLPRTDRLANISTRGRAGPGDDLLIAGFVLSGTGPRFVLIRAIGPSLGAFGVPGTLGDPRLALYRGETKLLENDNWSAATGSAELAAATARLGGFALGDNSADAALLVQLEPGAYTAQVSGPAGAAAGTALVEVYDGGVAPAPGATAPRLINIATRGRLGAAGDSLIAGIVVTGNAPKRLLLRAIGPGLAAFGATGTLADPILFLTGLGPAGATTLASNDDWGSPATGGATPAEIVAAAGSAGAFALPSGSKDACLLLTLAPGNYTAQVLGKDNGTGIALIEVYELNN